MSITLLNMDERLCRIVGDWIQFDTTTNIGAGTSVISTALNNYDRGQNDTFNNYYLYMEENNNAGVERLVYDYATATGTLSIRGANLSADSSATTCRLTRSRFDDRKQALNDALRETNAYLFNRLDDRTLVTGNILPNPSFEDWTATTIPDFYTASGTATVTENTTAGLHRRGSSSAKLTAGAASDYFYISSINHERLLDLAGKSVTFKAWAYPEVANDAFIQIYTVKADGTAQTLTSSTACPAAKWTKLELASQTINDGIVRIDIRFGVTTNAKYAYFDDVSLIGGEVNEYVLPLDFLAGSVDNVSIMPCDDDEIGSNKEGSLVFGWDEIDYHTYKVLRFKRSLPSDHLLRIVGHAPLTVFTTSASTANITDAQANALCEYAAYLLYTRLSEPVSADDSGKYYQKGQEHLMKWNSIAPRLKMVLPCRQFKVTPL